MPDGIRRRNRRTNIVIAKITKLLQPVGKDKRIELINQQIIVSYKPRIVIFREQQLTIAGNAREIMIRETLHNNAVF